jgi:hypothetical protein
MIPQTRGMIGVMCRWNTPINLSPAPLTSIFSARRP